MALIRKTNGKTSNLLPRYTLHEPLLKINSKYKLLMKNTNEHLSTLTTMQVNGTSLGWSLGYMINATEEISAGTSVPTLETVPFALLLVLFAMFLLLSIGFVFHGIKLRKSDSYQRLLH